MLANVTRAATASWAAASPHVAKMIAKTIAKTKTAAIIAAAAPAVLRAMVFIW
jgi:hypothetical protein